MNKSGVTLREIDLGFEEILEQVKLAEKSFVKVGFQVGSVTKTQRKGSRKQKPNLSMPEIAAANEFGTKHIPARPFMSTAVDLNLTSINKYIERQWGLILIGKSDVEQSLGLIGQYMTGLIQKRIRQIVLPPNSPTTIAIKKSSKPLIDFGQMVQSVRYIVELIK